jgi:uroporphyrinogen decarboxylase
MNSRERVLAALERRRPDRPPISLRGIDEVWAALEHYFGVATPQAVQDCLDTDLRWITLPFIGPAKRSAVPLGSEGIDYWGCKNRKVVNEFNVYYEFYDPPLAYARSVADVEAYDWPSLDWWDYSALPRLIDEATRGGPRAIMYHIGGAFETPWFLRGFEQFLTDLQVNPGIAEAISDRASTYYYERGMRAIDAARGRIDIISSGGDLGTQRGMLLNPRLWRQHIKPYAARLITPFRQMGFKNFYHSCGSCVPVIPDLIEMGVDVLDPIQVTATGMQPENLFRLFGDRLSFHGAIDETKLLNHGTPEQIRHETTYTIDILGQNGGYIVAPTHQVQGDTPVENILALFDAARSYRWTDSSNLH